MEQTVTTPTRTTTYISNIFFTNNKTLVNKCEVLPGIGDHDAVFIESSMRPTKVKKPPGLCLQKADFSSFNTELDDYFESFRDTTH